MSDFICEMDRNGVASASCRSHGRERGAGARNLRKGSPATPTGVPCVALATTHGPGLDLISYQFAAIPFRPDAAVRLPAVPKSVSVPLVG